MTIQTNNTIHAPVVVQNNQLQWTEEQIQLVKNTVCKGATNDEFMIFCHVVKKTGLDPFMKQIHAVKRRNKNTNRDDMSIQVGIDGYRLIADRTGQYAGSDDARFDDEKNPNKASVTVYKLVGGQRCSFTASARWDEYYPGDKQGFMWNKMPCVMLGKVAEALALRKAFPAELSGVYTNEEMEQANKEHTKSNVSGEPVNVKIVSSAPKPLGIVTNLNHGLLNANGEASGILVDENFGKMKAEGEKIRLLRTELEIGVEVLRDEIRDRFGTVEFKRLTLDQLQSVTAMLEETKGSRKAAEKFSEVSQSNDWMNEIPAGPAGSAK